MAACRQDVVGETHHFTFIAAVSMLRPASVLIIPTTFESVAKLCAVKVKVKVFVQAREYNEFDEQCEDDFRLRLDLGGELLGKRKRTRALRRSESGDLRSRGERRCCNKIKIRMLI